jgi:hypothetical protein
MTPEPSPDDRKRFYERRLPSGGYVAIETVRVRTLFGGFKIRGEIIVERRVPERRVGHIAPIAATVEATGNEDAVRALLPYARSEQDLAEILGRKVVASVTAGRRKRPAPPS